ncbi:UV-resistance associated gene isoform X2 [Leptinotarsa decemlineata]|uniref:UV-resistance associated gene isoform X2 n=1 Tax=Leptinotarsa decemlineata TaxID=7539 RepID=UPI003D3080DE
MSFSALEYMLSRQRGRQWVPLITQQYRLRHVFQIIGFNLSRRMSESFYFTLHLTTMSAPFYTSERMMHPHPKWEELNQRDMPNGSASCVVLRIWQHCEDGDDKILLTWGVHFSGLCYLGNDSILVQPRYFKDYSVIFCMQGGFYTSHQVIKTDLQIPIPFISNVNVIDTLNSKVIYKKVAIEVSRHEVQRSCNLEKLRRVHDLQIQIRNETVEANHMRDKLNALCGFNQRVETETQSLESDLSGSASSVWYAPQMLTMNSLNKMLKGNTTSLQKQKIMGINKQIEKAKFIIRLLAQEKDKKSVIIRGIKQRFFVITEDNEEKESDLMENYRQLSREAENLKECKKIIYEHRELYSNINMHLQLRRRQLLKQLLQIFPIERTSDDKFTICGIHLPNSDILADCSDIGLSVALGYIAHILVMASTFLQVPLRYPIMHYGSRSYITDNVSPVLPDKDRDFPLFTRGKDKVQFTYGVYLLNKNLAQFRWFLNMNTVDLKATLRNLLTFLQGPGELSAASTRTLPPPDRSLTGPKFVSLQRIASSSSTISDTILDSIRREKRISRSISPTTLKKFSQLGRGSPERGGKGLSEILAVPEAYLNRQISSESFRNFARTEKLMEVEESDEGSTDATFSATPTNHPSASLIKITQGKEVGEPFATVNIEDSFETSVEQGKDALDSPAKLSPVTKQPIDIHSGPDILEDSENAKENNRISRSLETSAESGVDFELSPEPHLEPSRNSPSDSREEQVQREYLAEWLESSPGSICSKEGWQTDTFFSLSAAEAALEAPLMARTDALLNTKSFNLIRPRQ